MYLPPGAQWDKQASLTCFSIVTTLPPTTDQLRSPKVGWSWVSAWIHGGCLVIVDRRNGDSLALTLELVKEGQLQLGTNYTNKQTNKNEIHLMEGLRSQEETEANLPSSKCLSLQNTPLP